MSEDLGLIRELAERTKRANQVWSVEALDAFDKLEGMDPKLVKKALEFFGNRETAAKYFARNHGRYGEMNCYGALAAGERETIIEAIVALQHGIF